MCSCGVGALWPLWIHWREHGFRVAASLMMLDGVGQWRGVRAGRAVHEEDGLARLGPPVDRCERDDASVMRHH